MDVIWTAERISFRNFAETAPSVIWMTDQNGHCIYVNPAWTKLAGQRVEDAAGPGWMNALHPEDSQPTLRALMAAMASQLAFQFEYRIRDAGRNYSWVSSSGWPQFNASGQCDCYVGSISAVGIREVKHPSTQRIHLTPREREVLELIATGKTGGDISTILGISKRTVEEHVRLAMFKTSTTNRVQVVIEALRQGSIIV